MTDFQTSSKSRCSLYHIIYLLDPFNYFTYILFSYLSRKELLESIVELWLDLAKCKTATQSIVNDSK